MSGALSDDKFEPRMIESSENTISISGEMHLAFRSRERGSPLAPPRADYARSNVEIRPNATFTKIRKT